MRRDLSDLAEALSELRSLMCGFPAPWAVAGGWAIDLYLGRITRAHEDVEIAVFRQDQMALRAHLRGWRFQKVADGALEDWLADELLELPVHEIHARVPRNPAMKLEILLNERSDDRWIFRRNPAVTLPLDRAIVRTRSGLPVLCPAIVLLYKSKGPRSKDEADFNAALPELDGPRRQWLGRSLQLCHPRHPWLARLS